MISKLQGYALIALGVIIAIWRVYAAGQKSAYNKVKVVAQESKIKAHQAYLKAKTQTNKGVQNVKDKISKRDYSSFNDD